MLLTLVQMGPLMPAPRGAQSTVHSRSQQPELTRDLFELQHRRPELEHRRSPQNNEQRESQNSGWRCMRSEAAGNGARGHASEFPRFKQSQTTHKQGPKRGRTAVSTVDADGKQERHKTARGPPTPNPGRKGRVGGVRLAVGEDREFCCATPTQSLAHQPYTGLAE